MLRAAGVLILAAALAGCHFNTRSAAGRTPFPSNTTMAQANSTAAPEMQLSRGPGSKYFAKESADTKGVTFAVWLNGNPINALFYPGKPVDVTSGMRGHANLVVVQWTRNDPKGSGTMTIQSGNNVVVTAKVTPSSPRTGKVSKTFIAKQAPVGRPNISQ